MSELIYALDIGTRKVAGLVGRPIPGGIEVVAMEVMEHSQRAMMDGQVHDIALVASLVRNVTRTLEDKVGVPLKEAAIAAAGRALQTAVGTARVSLSKDKPLTLEDVRQVERLALQDAMKDCAGDLNCVGYTPTAYRLSGQPMKTLEGHLGDNVEADVIATFLPQVVLDGLLGVLREAGLQASCLTLEPIAALEAVIPPDLRLLNLALVDIGAGTSDIAIVKNASVVAFAMVPVAGDEITEVLCKQWVMDFNQAEKLKRSLEGHEGGDLPGSDIFGASIQVPVAEALRSLEPAVKSLSRGIADRILELNHATPDAVVLVGGGSATPHLSDQLRVDLNLEGRRIGVRRPTQILELTDRTGQLTEAWGVTPAGILLIAARKKGLQVRQVIFNGIPRSILSVREKITLLDLVDQIGLSGLHSEEVAGKSLSFIVNDKPKNIPGKPGQKALFLVNGVPLSADDSLPLNAQVTYVPSQRGGDAQCTAEELQKEWEEIPCFINNLPLTLKPKVVIHGRVAQPSEKINSGDEVVVSLSSRLKDVLESQGFEIGHETSRQILVSVNQQPRFLTQKNFRLTAGGQEVDFDYQVRKNDILEFHRHVQAQYRIRDVAALPKDGEPLKIFVNGRPFALKGEKGRLYMNGQEVSPDEFVIDNAAIITRDGKPAGGMVSNVLSEMELPQPTRPGQRLNLMVDGVPASFSTKVKNGAQLIIGFE